MTATNSVRGGEERSRDFDPTYLLRLSDPRSVQLTPYVDTFVHDFHIISSYRWVDWSCFKCDRFHRLHFVSFPLTSRSNGLAPCCVMPSDNRISNISARSATSFAQSKQENVSLPIVVPSMLLCTVLSSIPCTF